MNEVDVSEMSHHDAVMTLKNAGKEVTLVVLREITDEDAIETALQVFLSLFCLERFPKFSVQKGFK